MGERNSALSKLASDTPQVSASLDDFIAKTHEQLDATPTPPTRPAMPAHDDVEVEPPRSRGWGGLAIAFALGCGATFGVMSLMPRHEAAPHVAMPTASAPKAPSVTPIEPVATQPIVTPVEPPAPVASAPKAHHTAKPTTKPAETAHAGSAALYNPF